MLPKQHLQRYLQKARFPLVTLAPMGLIALGWAGIVQESRLLESHAIETYQQAQLAVLRGAARSASQRWERQLAQRSTIPPAEVQQAILREFVAPAKLGTLGKAWLYASGSFISEQSDRQDSHLSIHDRFHHRQSLLALGLSSEGVGLYLGMPKPEAAKSEATGLKATYGDPDFAPWWDVLTQKREQYIAVWTSIQALPKTSAEQTWIIGNSIRLPELMRQSGTYAQIQTRIGTMLALSVLAGAMVWMLWRSECHRRDRDQAIHRLAYADMLTGLANRRQMYAVGDRILSDSKRSEDLALIYLDLNGFKDVNDSLGHDMGDALLVEVARRLRDCLRQQDLIARLGGDEFAILLYPRSLTDAKAVAQRMLRRLHQPFCTRGKSILIGASLGIAPVKASVRGLNFSQLLTQADIAMYQAKQRGSESVVVFGEEMQRAAIARVNLEMDLRQAIPNGELRLHYQPIFSLGEAQKISKPRAFEALVRWQHPQRGLLGPQDFLPEAENLGKLVEVDRWVMTQACQSLAEWQLELDSDEALGMHVNLSRISLAQPDLVHFVERLLDRYRLRPHCLTLEILEETIIDEAPILEENLHALRDLGVRLSLDDFGTGYSSLSYLHRLPIHGIKIDRSFVSQMLNSRENKEIICSIVALAQSLNLETVAEGIELSEQLEQLRSLRCQYIQGHLLSDGVEKSAAQAMLCKSAQQPWGERHAEDTF